LPIVCGRNAGAGNRLGAGTSRSSIWPVEAGLRSVSTAALCGLGFVGVARTCWVALFVAHERGQGPNSREQHSCPTPPPPPAPPPPLGSTLQWGGGGGGVRVPGAPPAHRYQCDECAGGVRDVVHGVGCGSIACVEAGCVCCSVRWCTHLAPDGARDRECRVRDPRPDCVAAHHGDAQEHGSLARDR